MVGILEAAVLGFVVLSVAYLLLAIYFRSLRRENLEKEWDRGEGEGARQDYIDAGMAEYAHSLRRRLILLVYVLPLIAVVVIAWWVNGQ